MDDQIFGKVASEMDFLKKIAAKIPGFRGYIERQNRRDADKMLRETLATSIEEQWQRISSMQMEFISKGDIGYLDDLEASAIKLRTFADRVRRATRGYAGLFDAIKIGADELTVLYQYDAQMLDMVDDISRAIDNVELSVGTEGLPAALRNLKVQTQKCIDTFNRREEVFLANTTEPKTD